MEAESKEKYYKILKQYWGYTEFRPMQLEIIELVCSGWDTLALMPTGAGKSLLYQIPALLKDGVCIVVTPLIALMKDQVDTLKSLGISAAAIHSGLTTRQIDLILDNACWGDLKFLYVAPERLTTFTFRERLRSMEVSLLAVDEAHCISQWGYDFRPSYLRIAEIREMLPETPTIALTASATPLVADDIMRHLKMENGVLKRNSFARPNISFVVRQSEDKEQQLLRILKNVPGSGIIYVRTRKTTETLTQWLTEQGVNAAFYHAGVPYGERNRKQELWMKGETRIVVATNAFGMGIDKYDVRFVIHYDMPDSPEAYYQEAGRAGRDGLRSYAVLFSASDDLSRSKRRFELEFPPIERIKECYEALFNYLQIGIGEGKFASFNFNIHHFSYQTHLFSGMSQSAIKILQQNEYMTLTDETDNPPRILFIVNRDDLYRIRIDREELDLIVRTLLRLYTGLFSERLVAIDIEEIAQTMGAEVKDVKELLKELWRMRVIKYVPGSRSPILILHEERLPTADVYISPQTYKIRKEMTIGRIEAIYEYAQNAERCRSVMLQEYFGETDAEDCGGCDICLTRKRDDRADDGESLNESKESGTDREQQTSEQILNLLEDAPLEIKKIIEKFRCTPKEVINQIDLLLEQGVVYMLKDGKMTIK